MANKTQFLVTIVDQAGAPLAVDRVVLSGASGKELTRPPFAFDLIAAGDAKLTVHKANHHTYEFSLKITDTGDDFTVRYAPFMIDAPSMASLAKVSTSSAAGASSKNLLKLTIGPVREVLLVVGFDYKSGSINRDHATCRMHDLAEAGKIDDSTVISVLEMETGEESHWVRGRGVERISGTFTILAGWSRLSLVAHPTPDLSLPPPAYPGAGTMGMPEVYRYIENIGRLRPGTLEELSFLSHSFWGGPILFNTDELAPFRQGDPRQDERDPADRDGRFWKDFKPINMPNKAQFVAAFSPTPFVKMWGCDYKQIWRDALRKARLATSDTQTLGVPVEIRTVWSHPATVFPDTRPGIHEAFRQGLYTGNYAYQLAKVIGKPVWGSPPGIGSRGLKTAFGRRGYVPEFRLAIVGGVVQTFEAIAKPELDYMKATFGWTFDEGNYVRYE